MKFATVFTALLLLLPQISASTTRIRISKKCIVAGHPFVVNVTNASPEPDDWVAIVSASQPTNTLTRTSIGWDFACGTQSCLASVSSGVVSIQSNVSPGLYKAVLARNGVSTFRALAVSQTVRVVTTSEGCLAKSPVSSPVVIATPPPTPAPKGLPKGGGVSGPTPAPFSGLVNSVFTDKATYAFEEAIRVSFTSAQPKNNDFLALFPAATSNLNLLTGYMWQFTCGRQGATPCSSPIKDGTVVFSGSSSNWGQSWPLLGGQYVAYLLRFSFVGPFTTVAQSGAFTIESAAPPGSPGAARTAMLQAQAIIANMVFQNKNLTAKFLRMGFHDCVGGVCDGCIDLTDPDNNGLDVPIDVIAPVVQQFANSETGLSRADIWALAATVGVDVAGHGVVTQPISFTMNWYGRVDCEVANKVCRNFKGVSVPCIATQGPARTAPSVNLNSKEVLQYFAQNFNFTERQTVTIMGAHTVGSLRRAELGIDGPHGWTIDNVDVHNEYYAAFIGAATSTSSDSQIYLQSPGWKRIFLNNTGVVNAPSRNFWRLNISGVPLAMTNADISLVRNLDSSNMDPVTGHVNCAFRPKVEESNVPLCPIAETTFQTAVAFFQNNDLWLSEFKDALDLVLTNGYHRVTCSYPLCKLSLK